MTSRPHVYLHPQCGACGDAFVLRERIVAVLRKSSSIQVINVYTFPDYGISLHAPLHIDTLFCRRPSCSQCSAVAADSTTIHVDCFNLFRQHCRADDALYRLWLAATWRSPWRGAPSLRLPPDINVNKTMQLAATVCSLPKLASIPTEILYIIWGYTQPSLISRYRTVIDLAADLDCWDLDWQPSLLLSKLASWERGGRAVIKENIAPIVRITIDCWGLKSIDRLMDIPEISCKRSDMEVYITETQERLRDIEVQFQSGLARLQVPKGFAGLQLWDTPTPPSLESLQNPPAITGTVQFATIDVKRVNGITFFVSAGYTLAIHGHTSRMPYPQTTFNQLSRRRRRNAAWIYVPFPPKDRISHFGIRVPHDSAPSSDSTSFSYLFRFELAGDLVIGPYYEGPKQDFIWPVREQLSLVFPVAELRRISAISAYPQRRGEISPFAQLSQPPLRCACFSSAPLENLALLRVYSDPETGLCRGLLAEYNNGSQRSLGMCRVGLDPVRTYKNPEYLCFARVTNYRPRTSLELLATKVSSSCQPEHKHEEGGWSCFAMRGTLQFWFTNEQSMLEVMVDS